jgi:CBS domain containing-hemolysin-like protein
VLPYIYMLLFIVALLMILLALLALTLEKTYFYVPKKELKRQAALGDELASTLFSAATYDRELKLLLWFITGLSAAAGIVLFAREAPPLQWLPRTRLTLTGARIAEWCTPGVVRLLRVLHPLLKRLVAAVSSHHVSPHTGLYEREDMEELIERQRLQSDNRISNEELERMNRLLQFGHYQVADIVVPREQVVAVDVNDTISPVRLDELHKSGHPRFPVYEGKESNIIGTLALDTITDTRHHGAVRDIFDTRSAYVHESDSLEQTLQAFFETRQHLFIVVNSADEYLGIITLSDILHCLVGALEHEHFGRYEDRKAVVERRHHKPKKEPAVLETAGQGTITPEPSESSENMVE